MYVYKTSLYLILSTMCLKADVQLRSAERRRRAWSLSRERRGVCYNVTMQKSPPWFLCWLPGDRHEEKATMTDSQ